MAKEGIVFVGFIMMVMGFLLIVSGAVIDISAEKEIIDIKCYDEHNNEIKELTCIGEEVKNEEMSFVMKLFYTLGFILFIIGFLWVLMIGIVGGND